MCSVIVSLSLGIPYLMDPMVMSVLYVWCQINRDQVVVFWFGVQFKAMYLPWVIFGLTFVFLLSKNHLLSNFCLTYFI